LIWKSIFPTYLFRPLDFPPKQPNATFSEHVMFLGNPAVGEAQKPDRNGLTGCGERVF